MVISNESTDFNDPKEFNDHDSSSICEQFPTIFDPPICVNFHWLSWVAFKHFLSPNLPVRQDWGVFGGRAQHIPDTRSVPKFFFDTQPNPIQFTFEYHRVLHYISGIPDIFW